MPLSCCLLTTKWYVRGIRIKFGERIQILAGLQGWRILNKKETTVLSSLIAENIKLCPYALHSIRMHCEVMQRKNSIHLWIENPVCKKFDSAFFPSFLSPTHVLRHLKIATGQAYSGAILPYHRFDHSIKNGRTLWSGRTWFQPWWYFSFNQNLNVFTCK